MIYYPTGLIASLSLVLGLRNQFHTRPLSAFFELLRRKHFLLFLLKQAHFYHQLCAFLPLLSTLLVVRAKLSSASFSFTSKLLKRLNHTHSTHLLNVPKFFNTSSSGCSPATWVTWLLWSSRPSPWPSCGTCSFGFFGSDSWPVPAFSHSSWLVNAGILKVLSLGPCSSFYSPADLTH